jgi:hypothetical protein
MQSRKAKKSTDRRKMLAAGTIAVLTVGLVGIATPAFASNIGYYFNVVAPVFQGGAITGSQTKTTTGHWGFIDITSVGSSYKTNAQMCSLSGFYCGGGTKVLNLDDFSSARLPQTYVAGTSVTAQLQISSFNTASVQVVGYLAVW